MEYDVAIFTIPYLKVTLMVWLYKIFKSVFHLAAILSLKKYVLNIIETEAVARRSSVNKVFLEISQNSQENTCARGSFVIKLEAWPATLLKKSLWHRCFPVNFPKFLRTPFLTEHLRWLLL